MSTHSLLASRLVATGIVAALSLTLARTVKARLLPEAPVEPEVVAAEVVPLPPEPVSLTEASVTHIIRKGESLGTVLAQYGVTEVNDIRQAALRHRDLSKIRAGDPLTLAFVRGRSKAVSITLPFDDDRELVVDLTELEPEATLVDIPYEARVGHRAITIEGTLWKAAVAAGLRPKDILKLATIFEYDVDFNTELRAGDTFTLVMDELWLEGEYARPGAIHAVRMENRGDSITAVAFEDPESGELGWYAPDGTTRRKPFLRSPLAFSAVTSGYNLSRMDPIANRTIAHVGTDFGAPTGTAVRAVGDAVVAYAGWYGGYGMYIKLDHEGPYDTAYAHLSHLSVKTGQTIKQGDIIGKVGTTGYSTGPHLHYELHVNGSPVDAMSAKLPSTGRELDAETMPLFEAVRDQWVPLLDTPDALADSR